MIRTMMVVVALGGLGMTVGCTVPADGGKVGKMKAGKSKKSKKGKKGGAQGGGDGGGGGVAGVKKGGKGKGKGKGKGAKGKGKSKGGAGSASAGCCCWKIDGEDSCESGNGPGTCESPRSWTTGPQCGQVCCEYVDGPPDFEKSYRRVMRASCGFQGMGSVVSDSKCGGGKKSKGKGKGKGKGRKGGR